MIIGLNDLTIDRLPSALPVFPLPGALLLPTGQLPLNIFEPRYLAMIDTALAGERMIGMVQPNAEVPDTVPDEAALYDTGCAGRITSFAETEDGRYLITLTGIARFRIDRELEITDGFRNVAADYTPYANDLAEDDGVIEARDGFLDLLRRYFDRRGIEAEWGAIEQASDATLATSLAMICPFEPREKQALLECDGVNARGDLLRTLMEIALHDGAADGAATGPRH